jgi:hypothetical protein
MMSGDLTQLIRQRAYEIWEREGRPHGRDRIHWLRAEAEIRDAKPAMMAGASPAAEKARPATKTSGRSRNQPVA